MPTPVFGDADVQAVIDGAGGVSVTVGAVTANGKLRAPDTDLQTRDEANEFQARESSVLLRTSAFAGILHQGTAITVDGSAYKITQTQQLGSGMLTRVFFAP